MPPPNTRFALVDVTRENVNSLYEFFAPAQIPYTEEKLKLAYLRNGEALCASIGGVVLSCAVFYDPWGENKSGSIYELGLLATDQRLRGKLRLGQTVHMSSSPS